MIHAPSPAQLKTYQSRGADKPVVLYYQYRMPDRAPRTSALTAIARQYGGGLRWSGIEEQVLIGNLPLYSHCACLHFPTRRAALALVQSAPHAALFESAEALQVVVISEQPKLAKWVIALMSVVLPRLRFDNRVDHSPEPGIGTSIMPTESALQAFLAHPDQRRPIVMVNWLRFRPQAQYAPGASEGAAPVSGKTAYYRYGKVAFKTLHSLGAHAFFVSRYQQMLIGHGGDPAPKLWDEFVLVRYPSRAAFKHMTSLYRYRAALHHRTAGLDEGGQGLVVSRTQTTEQG